MKLTLSILVIVSLSFTVMNNNKQSEIEIYKNHYPSGISGGYAGAPNEQSCVACHSGNTQSGSGINTLTLSQNGNNVSSYEPGQVYTVTLTGSSSTNKRGFQAVAYNSANQKTGTFSTVTSGCTQITGGRATHTTSSNSNCNSEWKWSWTAPSSDVGDVTFYVSTMSANGNGSTSGDIVYLSQHVFGGLLGLKEETSSSKHSFKASYVSDNNTVNVQFNSLTAGRMYFNLVDLSGKSIYTYSMDNASIGENNLNIVLPKSIEKGVYVVNFFVHNDVMSYKIMVQ
jgi:hypothetical protein